MALDYLLFEHKGEKIGAFISISYRSMSFEFQDDFFRSGNLVAFSRIEIGRLSKLQGYDVDSTAIDLLDKNGFWSHFRYNNGNYALREASTRKDGIEINPKRAFAFWTSLSTALISNPRTPKPFKSNLEQVAHISSLDFYIEQLAQKRNQKPEEIFNNDYLRREMQAIAQDYLNPKYF
jgi:hypothetical protein